MRTRTLGIRANSSSTSGVGGASSAASGLLSRDTRSPNSNSPRTPLRTLSEAPGSASARSDGGARSAAGSGSGKDSGKVDKTERWLLTCSIKDTGIGISQSQMQLLFQTFSQVEHRSGEYGGTGLGLVISMRLVEKMGGDISVESQLGVGSTFSFTIVAEVPPSHSAAGSSASGAGAAQEGGGSNSNSGPASAVMSPETALSSRRLSPGQALRTLSISTGSALAARTTPHHSPLMVKRSLALGGRGSISGATGGAGASALPIIVDSVVTRPDALGLTMAEKTILSTSKFLYIGQKHEAAQAWGALLEHFGAQVQYSKDADEAGTWALRQAAAKRAGMGDTSPLPPGIEHAPPVPMPLTLSGELGSLATVPASASPLLSSQSPTSSPSPSPPPPATAGVEGGTVMRSGSGRSAIPPPHGGSSVAIGPGGIGSGDGRAPLLSIVTAIIVDLDSPGVTEESVMDALDCGIQLKLLFLYSSRHMITLPTATTASSHAQEQHSGGSGSSGRHSLHAHHHPHHHHHGGGGAHAASPPAGVAPQSPEDGVLASRVAGVALSVATSAMQQGLSGSPTDLVGEAALLQEASEQAFDAVTNATPTATGIVCPPNVLPLLASTATAVANQQALAQAARNSEQAESGNDNHTPLAPGMLISSPLPSHSASPGTGGRAPSAAALCSVKRNLKKPFKSAQLIHALLLLSEEDATIRPQPADAVQSGGGAHSSRCSAGATLRAHQHRSIDSPLLAAVARSGSGGHTPPTDELAGGNTATGERSGVDSSPAASATTSASPSPPSHRSLSGLGSPEIGAGAGASAAGGVGGGGGVTSASSSGSSVVSHPTPTRSTRQGATGGGTAPARSKLVPISAQYPLKILVRLMRTTSRTARAPTRPVRLADLCLFDVSFLSVSFSLRRTT
jgi:hypothetical protein